MKTKEMQEFLDGFSKLAFGNKRSESLNEHVCVRCRAPAIDFKDAISKREYGISGYCQKCQDEIFK